MKFLFTLFSFLATWSVFGQISFEYLNLPIDTFINDNSEGFKENNITLPNDYNADFNSFTGFALSTMTDTETQGFLNQYSVISGGGAEGTSAYAVGFLFANNSVFFEEPISSMGSFYVNNTTYAALSMENGDPYAKKFGGESGDDPDFFLLTLHFLNDGMITGDSITFYLADYRFEDNSMDYIIREWTEINLSDITTPYDEIQFVLSSSDVGAFGMNTPNYIAIDHFTIDPASISFETSFDVTIFPNPTHGQLVVSSENKGKFQVLTAFGELLQEGVILEGYQGIDVSLYPSGIYYMKINNGKSSVIKKFIKQ